MIPPSNEYSPPQTKAHDLSQAYNPPAEAYNPPAEAYNPPVDAHNPPAQAYNPPAEAYNPPAKAYNPPVETHNPPVDAYNPPDAAYNPPVVAYNPPAEAYNPPVNAYKSPAEAYNPQVDAYKSSVEAYNPPAEAYNPYNSPTKVFNPPKQIYNAPPKIHGTPSKAYTPPPKAYNPPPSKAYTPPPKAYNPPPSKAHNSPTENYNNVPTRPRPTPMHSAYKSSTPIEVYSSPDMEHMVPPETDYVPPKVKQPQHQPIHHYKEPTPSTKYIKQPRTPNPYQPRALKISNSYKPSSVKSLKNPYSPNTIPPTQRKPQLVLSHLLHHNPYSSHIPIDPHLHYQQQVALDHHSSPAASLEQFFAIQQQSLQQAPLPTPVPTIHQSLAPVATQGPFVTPQPHIAAHHQSPSQPTLPPFTPPTHHQTNPHPAHQHPHLTTPVPAQLPSEPFIHHPLPTANVPAHSQPSLQQPHKQVPEQQIAHHPHPQSQNSRLPQHSTTITPFVHHSQPNPTKSKPHVQESHSRTHDPVIHHPHPTARAPSSQRSPQPIIHSPHPSSPVHAPNPKLSMTGDITFQSPVSLSVISQQQQPRVPSHDQTNQLSDHQLHSMMAFVVTEQTTPVPVSTPIIQPESHPPQHFPHPDPDHHDPVQDNRIHQIPTPGQHNMNVEVRNHGEAPGAGLQPQPVFQVDSNHFQFNPEPSNNLQPQSREQLPTQAVAQRQPIQPKSVVNRDLFDPQTLNKMRKPAMVKHQVFQAVPEEHFLDGVPGPAHSQVSRSVAKLHHKFSVLSSEHAPMMAALPGTTIQCDNPNTSGGYTCVSFVIDDNNHVRHKRKLATTLPPFTSTTAATTTLAPDKKKASSLDLDTVLNPQSTQLLKTIYQKNTEKKPFKRKKTFPSAPVDLTPQETEPVTMRTKEEFYKTPEILANFVESSNLTVTDPPLVPALAGTTVECKYPDQTGIYSCFSFQNMPKVEENQEVVVVKKNATVDSVQSIKENDSSNHDDKRVTTNEQSHEISELSTEMPVRIKHPPVSETDGTNNFVDDPKQELRGHVKSDNHVVVKDVPKRSFFSRGGFRETTRRPVPHPSNLVEERKQESLDKLNKILNDAVNRAIKLKPAIKEATKNQKSKYDPILNPVTGRPIGFVHKDSGDFYPVGGHNSETPKSRIHISTPRSVTERPSTSTTTKKPHTRPVQPNSEVDKAEELDTERKREVNEVVKERVSVRRIDFTGDFTPQIDPSLDTLTSEFLNLMQGEKVQ